MKLSVLVLCLCAALTPAFAEDAQKIVERKTCEQIKSEIASLSAIDKLNDDQQSELKQLSALQRANCGIKSGGRRTIPRAQIQINDVEPVSSTVVVDALTEYMNSKKSNCEKLNDEIAKLVPDTDSVKVVQEMQRVYNADCVEHVAPDVAPEPEQPTKTDEEWAAEFDANLAAGLCGDGTKPNKFGCCTDETFKDLGDAVFACCPNIGGICFPPIK